MAIFETKDLSSVSRENKYLDIPLKIVIEVDTKAALTNLSDPLSYNQQKTTELLDFGVGKVIWIFTEIKRTLVAEQSNDIWQLQPWSKTVAVEKNVTFNLQE